MFGPADDDHQLAVGQVAQRGQGLDVSVGHGGVRHGIDLLWLHHQQMGNDLCHWESERTTDAKIEEKRQKRTGVIVGDSIYRYFLKEKKIKVGWITLANKNDNKMFK